jgi:hypothetical protein
MFNMERAGPYAKGYLLKHNRNHRSSNIVPVSVPLCIYIICSSCSTPALLVQPLVLLLAHSPIVEAKHTPTMLFISFRVLSTSAGGWR